MKQIDGLVARVIASFLEKDQATQQDIEHYLKNELPHEADEVKDSVFQAVDAAIHQAGIEFENNSQSDVQFSSESAENLSIRFASLAFESVSKEMIVAVVLSEEDAVVDLLAVSSIADKEQEEGHELYVDQTKVMNWLEKGVRAQTESLFVLYGGEDKSQEELIERLSASFEDVKCRLKIGNSKIKQGRTSYAYVLGHLIKSGNSENILQKRPHASLQKPAVRNRSEVLCSAENNAVETAVPSSAWVLSN